VVEGVVTAGAVTYAARRGVGNPFNPFPESVDSNPFLWLPTKCPLT
jgi:hypothetical protein